MPISYGQPVSLSLQRKLGETTDKLTSTFQRLSSGQRINKASDDAAGLALATSLTSSARVFTQALRNVSDGISLSNMASSALGELSTISERLKELATQASNETYTNDQRSSLNDEADALVDEFNRIVASVSFNGLNPYEAAPSSYGIQAGYGSRSNILLQFGNELSRAVGNGSFTQTTTLADSIDLATAIGDFNSDGKFDLIRTDSANSKYYLYYGNGNGTFAAPISRNSALAASETFIGDFNGDGDDDIVFSGSGLSALSIVLGNGNGTFQAAVTYQLSSAATSPPEAVDFNGDGYDDILIGKVDGFDVLLANSNGTFAAPVSIANASSIEAIVALDINGDGNQDFIGYDDPTGATFIHLGNGNGTFTASTSLALPDGSFLVKSDYNRDGREDILAGDLSSGSFRVALGNSNGTFDLSATYSVNLIVTGKGDFNGDGIQDLLGNDLDSTYNILYGNGDGTFRLGISSTYSNPDHDTGFLLSADQGDFNSDGVADPILFNVTDTSLVFYLSDTVERSTIPYLSISSAAAAASSITTVQGIIDRITTERGAVGAYESRLSVAFSNLESLRENYTAAATRITDADIAQDAADMVRLQILQNATVAVMAQANQTPSLLLSLLEP